MNKMKSKKEDKELYEKIEKAKSLIQLNSEQGKTDIEKLLKERAQKAARLNKQTDDQIENISIFEFLLGKEHYAVKTHHLKEILVTNKITEIPCTPDFIYGVINIRGNIVSVIDLKKFLHLDYVGINDNASVIVIDYNGKLVGVVADEIIGIKNIDNRKVQKEKPKTVKIKDEFIQGITDETVVILNMEKLLSEKSLLVDEKVV